MGGGGLTKQAVEFPLATHGRHRDSVILHQINFNVKTGTISAGHNRYNFEHFQKA